jgi:hypothetical protein
MLTPTTAAYGSWKSPITSDLVAQSITLSEARFDGEDIYWLEGRPQESGRLVVVRTNSLDGHATDVTPKPYNARTRVHEYGGASWTVADGDIYFSNFVDARLYRQAKNSSHPIPLTPAPAVAERQWRFADGIIDRARQRWIGVLEDHTVDGEPVNTIVAVDLHQPGREPARVLVGGHDFFASPRLSPDGRWLIWLTWDHPNLPWNGTTLWLSELDGPGNKTEPLAIAGSVSESVFQPEWSPDGTAISSCPTAAAGGISTASILSCGHLNRLRRWPLSSACRCGNSVQRPMPVPDRIGSSAAIPKLGSANLQSLT